MRKGQLLDHLYIHRQFLFARNKFKARADAFFWAVVGQLLSLKKDNGNAGNTHTKEESTGRPFHVSSTSLIKISIVFGRFRTFFFVFCLICHYI